MTIEVKKGYDCSTVLTYPTRGNEAFAQYKSALVIKFELEEGELKTNYKRKGDDLILTVHMSLEEALLSRPIHVKTLDGRSINVNLDTMITPQTVH
jgi:DnaJ-class molecular chaperone